MILSNKEFSNAIQARIQTAYETSGNNLGWRLLASPSNVLDSADVAFIGLNPGGSRDPTDHPNFSMPGGSAYTDETWGRSVYPGQSPLQKQVRALFAGLGVEPEKVLAGNLVPFRSQSWKTLQNRERCLEFGTSLWADILCRARPGLVIGMGGAVLDPLTSILEAKNHRRVSVRWGNVTATHANFSEGSLVVLPHLSRFGIVTRSESAEALTEIFGERWLRQ